MRLTAVSIYSRAKGSRLREKVFAMTESWMGIVAGSFVLAIAATAIIGHYRREHVRKQLLRRMDHRQCWDVMRRRR